MTKRDPETSEITTTTSPDETTHSPAVFFDEDFWSRNARPFTLFAARLLYRRLGRLRSGRDADDYVSESAVQLMSGQRHYTTRYSRETCVYATIASLISHDPYANDAEVDEALLDDDTADIDELIAVREFLEKYKENFSGELHRRYLDLMAGGYISTAEAAEELGVPEAEIANIRKVIRRPRDKWPGRAAAHQEE